MKKLKLIMAFCALILGWSSASAQKDVTASYIGDVTWIVNGGGWHGSCSNNHKESNGIGWWNNQTISGSHAFANPSGSDPGESWSPNFGSAGVMMGRTMVLPSGNYTLSFQAFACNATNSVDPAILPNAGDAVAFLTGKDNVDITNTASAGDATFHDVSFTFDVTTANTAFEFGIKKLTDDSKIDWCQIKNVTLTLNSANIFAVANDNTSSFAYSGSQTWHTNTWSVEGQSDGSRFQVPFHELWVANGGKLDDATITGSYTPNETGVYKVSAWVRAVNESGGAVSGVKIFVGDTESDACSGSSVMSGKGRLGTYTAMADGVSGTPFNYGFIIKDAAVNWLAFKNVTITYLGALPQSEIDALLDQVPTGKMSTAVQAELTSKVNDLNTNKTVAAYNALASYISTANASIIDYEALKNAIAVASNYTPIANVAAYNTLISTAQGIYDNASVEDCSETINGLATAKQSANVADYEYVAENFPYSVELGAWTTENATTRKGQHWDGTEASTYFEQADGWGEGNWTCSYSQDLSLPAGNYVFKVAGRKSFDDATLTLKVTNGNEVMGLVSDFPNGDTGKGIETSGVANFGDGTYAKNPNHKDDDLEGCGWQWRFVKFTLAEPATVNVAVTGAATPKYNWVGFCNPTVQTDNEENVALMAALVALNSAKTKATLTKSTNVGIGVFQYNEPTNELLWEAYTTAKSNAEAYEFTSSSTASEVNALATELTTAITNYQSQSLNAPDADKRYNVSIVEAGKDWDGNAITFIAGGRDDQGKYGVKYLAPANANLNQALKFTPVIGEPNTYKVSAIRVVDGVEQYLTTGKTYEGNNDQIRTTEDVTRAMLIKVEATSTSNQFQLRNVAADKIIANNGNNDVYTAGSANFTIAEASQATVDMTIDANVKYATRIFPFTPTTWPNGVVAYSCATTDGDALVLEEVAQPVANVPYILYAENGSTGSVTDWGTAPSTDVVKAGMLNGVYANTDAPVNSYVLQKINDKVGFYKVAAEKQPTVGAYHCYLTDGENAAHSAYFFGGAITGVNSVEAASEAKAKEGKFIENGKLVIVKNGVKYNAAGAQVK